MSNRHETRESWLRSAVAAMRPWFKEQEQVDPGDVLISVGFPKYSASQAIGQCWDPKNNLVQDENSVHHLFICPTIEDPIRVLDILLHELVHASVGCDCGHRGAFKKTALRFGLAGKMTATYAEQGTPLYERLQGLAEELGPYPHRALKRPVRTVKTSKWIRLKSTTEPEYKVVISPAMLEEHGFPTDPWGEEMVPNKEE